MVAGRRSLRLREPKQQPAAPCLGSGQLPVVAEIGDNAGEDDRGWASKQAPKPSWDGVGGWRDRAKDHNAPPGKRRVSRQPSGRNAAWNWSWDSARWNHRGSKEQHRRDQHDADTLAKPHWSVSRNDHVSQTADP